MPGPNAAVETPLDRFRRAQFGLSDILRRAQGDTVATFGLGPTESPYRIVASGPYWRLRDYGGPDAARSLLIAAAPIKRPYIWDLAPSASAIRYCLRRDLHVYLVEWLPASHKTGNSGLDEYARAISDCVARISDENAGPKPFLIGHSLGGTLAAIYGGLESERIEGLVLLGAPLCFQPKTSRFRDALVSLLPPTLCETEPVPGSLLSHASAFASPDTFIWERLIDAALSMADRHAMEIHARVERWALDEVALPGKLVRDIVEDLYRENRLCRGLLKVRGALVGPFCVSTPTLAVVNMADEVAPLASMQPFLEAMPTNRARLIRYAGETGVCLQHLGILIGRKAREKIWPEILSWLKSSG
jgi:poly[(R)-3-hydroxyalkanoate] polymerase subunit PhaC